jgi:hypothetical protein
MAQSNYRSLNCLLPSRLSAHKLVHDAERKLFEQYSSVGKNRVTEQQIPRYLANFLSATS